MSKEEALDGAWVADGMCEGDIGGGGRSPKGGEREAVGQTATKGYGGAYAKSQVNESIA